MAYDVDAVRAAIASGRADLLVSAGANPTEDVRDALITARKHLKARKVKHFAHEGRVVSRRSYEDNEAQLRAVDTLLTVYGAYAPKAQSQQAAVGVEVVINPDGTLVVRAVNATGGGQATP